MLQQMRKSAGSWIVKLLMLLLVASFALWGVESYIGGSGEPVIAEVGDQEIRASQFQADYRQQLARLQQQMRQRIDPEMAKRLGLPEQLLQQQIDDLLMEQTATAMGLHAPDDVVRALIVQNPAFVSDGRFNPLAFQNLLAQLGMTEAEYIQAVRMTLRGQAVADSVAAGTAPAPEALARALVEHAGEKRRADYLVVPKAAMPLPEDPDEETLRAFYAEHPAEFTAPELRAVSWIELSPDAVAETLELDETALRDAFEERRDALVVPPRRTLRQVAVDDEPRARAIAEAAGAGTPLARAAAEAGAVAPVELGTLTRDDLADLLGAAAADAAFAATGPGVLAPVQSPLGWHVLEVTDLSDGAEPSFDEVREELARTLRHEQAVDRIYGLANRAEDLIAGGARLKEIAEALGLPLQQHPGIDVTGRDIEGLPAGVPPAEGRLRRTLWEMEAGSEPETVEEDGDTYFVLQLDEVRPSQLRPFEEVQAQVRAAWTESRKAELAVAQAEQIAAELRNGADLQDVAAGLELTVAEPAPFDRQGMGAELPFDDALLTAIFAAEPGQVVTGRTYGGDAVVAVLEEILPVTDQAPEAEQLRAQLAQRWSNGFRSDLAQAFREGLAGTIGVKIDRDQLDRAI